MEGQVNVAEGQVTHPQYKQEGVKSCEVLKAQKKKKRSSD
jgi:hypothetical protein